MRSRFFCAPAIKHWTSSTPFSGCSMVHRSLLNRSTCAFWAWRTHSTVSLMAAVDFVSAFSGQRGSAGSLQPQPTAECKVAKKGISSSKSEVIVIDGGGLPSPGRRRVITLTGVV
ncbi:hypothetical protein ILYODFUR_031884 [Ilyodon furcidens]|uniref:Secreted protein n=1 Tax=Ilyodon furcidens TaxID=33524 RepID=A0ABV0TNH6_9TELE